ncbi:hypothetical protein [Spirosoma foliorum]|uniref:Uncharacterized protein n=1 Tax=Spirosoma foliorum TaxID=2710596 RepID=A0A7G5GQS2_9BACT|nr:hypothetical protein [Spirosoma foliorum]QMW01214.1 hypothetical protein H3H32_25035 [Spirosoma foliorum]
MERYNSRQNQATASLRKITKLASYQMRALTQQKALVRSSSKQDKIEY